MESSGKHQSALGHFARVAELSLWASEKICDLSQPVMPWQVLYTAEESQGAAEDNVVRLPVAGKLEVDAGAQASMRFKPVSLTIRADGSVSPTTDDDDDLAD